MVDAIGANPFSDATITAPEEIQLIRLAALLHDLAHIPFGHTLEDEANLFPGQWDAPGRSPNDLIGPSTTIGKIIDRDLGRPILTELVQVLNAKDHEPDDGRKVVLVEDLPRPFIADLVANTVCADLLDYLRRDIYYCGLKEAYDERFLNYLVLTLDPDTRKARVAIRLVGAKGRVRRDNVSEILHLLRLRYSLAEKVYYHPAKISSSTMISEAVRRSAPLLKRKLVELGDEALLEELRANGDAATQSIVERLSRHALFVEVFRHSYRVPMLSDRSEDTRRSELAKTLRSPTKRAELAKRIEKMSSLTPGSVAVYCPPFEMGLKEARVRVVWKEKLVTELKDVSDLHIKSEIEGIQEDHLRLWHIGVFIDRAILHESEDPAIGLAVAKGIARDAEDELRLSNDEDRYAGETRHWNVRAVDEFCKVWDPKNSDATVTQKEATALQTEILAAWNPSEDSGNWGFDNLAERLRVLRQGRTGPR
jgi:HD superfamily phosphohydrolase